MTTSRTGGAQAADVRMSSAIRQLSAVHRDLADVLANLTATVAEEACQNADFAVRLKAALVVGNGLGEAVIAQHTPISPDAAPAIDAPVKARPRRGRRAPGPWDPFVVYAQVGEDGLRERLNQLELEQLRDMIAEHGMNSDGLAMKWRKADRVVSRIVERVVDRAAKGDAFRGG